MLLTVPFLSKQAFYVWGNEPTVMGVLGIFTTLGGSLLYTFVKMSENAQSAPGPQRQPVEQKEHEMSKV